ncbi:MAG TPA: CpaD family pilus assembly lipoprotein [Allosphingosinicella sp.]|nr:CpaD family pilus assembly lipoprotein [Allosphingosinicella sp.]
MTRFISLAAVSALGLAVAGCAGQPRQLSAANNTSVYSLHQPVVEHTNYVFDLNAQGDRVSDAELERLAAWFESIELRYGDKLSLDDGGAYSTGARADIARLLAEYGLTLEPGAPVTQGTVPQGSVRLVASRSSASVPGCPEWGDPGIDSPVRTGTNYGCATNSNLASMIANPDDLIHGRGASGAGSGQVAGRAIRVYREGQPTGRNGLQQTTTTGGR